LTANRWGISKSVTDSRSLVDRQPVGDRKIAGRGRRRRDLRARRSVARESAKKRSSEKTGTTGAKNETMLHSLSEVTEQGGGRLRRLILFSLFALAFCAPHSIAATQLFWAVGLLLWAALLCTKRGRAELARTPLDYALLGFFALTIISSLFSYEPEVSIGKLRGASLFTIAYLVAQNVRTLSAVRKLALVLITSCMINVGYTFIERAIGRGVKIYALAANSPLRAAKVQEGDTLLEVDGHKIKSAQDLESALSTPSAQPAQVKVYRYEWVGTLDVPRALLNGTSAEERLGIVRWGRGRDWRASGFYGHYATYAEVLQLIASLALGLLVAAWQGGVRQRAVLSLTVALVGLLGALFLTVTRASWLAFLLSGFVIVAVGTMSRRAVLAMGVAALLVAPFGISFLQQKRNVGFFDRRDGSIQWRETVYREGLHLLISRPRHLLVGIGMDSIKRHWREWGMFDQGRLPIGHMHSTPLQLALERGIPTLVVWLILLALYARMLWRMLRERDLSDWRDRGIVLGALGGLVGFFASGLVHYNLGDSEVAMVFYFIMGLTLAIERETVRDGI
jgi:hypothetical protein